jgi:hypothetical protein
MLKNYRRHAMLEVAGRWPEILGPGMLVDEPEYRLFEGGQGQVLRGRQEIASFYSNFAASGATVFGPLEERISVADWGLSFESYFGNHLRGFQLRAMGRLGSSWNDRCPAIVPSQRLPLCRNDLRV